MEAEVTEEQIENMVDSVVKTYTSDSKFSFCLLKLFLHLKLH